MSRPLRDLRRAGRRWLGRAVAKAVGRPPAAGPVDPLSVRRVLVCRVNRRLGNLVLLTPLLRSLARTLPHATVDLLLGAGAPASVLRGMPGLGQIHQVPRNAASGPLELPRLVGRLQALRFDLALDPCLSSTANRLALALCGARWRLGFAVPDGWAPLTHSLVPGHALEHEALRPLGLLESAFGPGAVVLAPGLDLALGPAEIRAGLEVLDAAAPAGSGALRIGFFCDAAAGKGLDAAWWAEWCREMRRLAPGTVLVQVLPPGARPVVIAGVAPLRCPDPRLLASALAGVDLFTSCDTGPMHLASAAHAPTIGLFTTTNPVQYGPYAPEDLSLEVAGVGPGSVAARVLEHARQLGRPAPVGT